MTSFLNSQKIMINNLNVTQPGDIISLGKFEETALYSKQHIVQRCFFDLKMKRRFIIGNIVFCEIFRILGMGDYFYVCEGRK